MNDDYGGQLADRAAHESYCEEHGACPECGTNYDDSGYCYCEDEW